MKVGEQVGDSNNKGEARRKTDVGSTSTSDQSVEGQGRVWVIKE